jgi:hypothetical protein
VSPTPVARRRRKRIPYRNRYLIAIAVTLAAVLERRHVDRERGDPAHDGHRWARRSMRSRGSTSYIIANVIVIPMSSWLSGYFGRRRYLTDRSCCSCRVILLRGGHVAVGARLRRVV